MPTTPTPIDEWIAGESPDYQRQYVVHTCAPGLSRPVLIFSERRLG
jgi:hypothetical protein